MSSPQPPHIRGAHNLLLAAFGSTWQADLLDIDTCASVVTEVARAASDAVSEMEQRLHARAHCRVDTAVTSTAASLRAGHTI